MSAVEEIEPVEEFRLRARSWLRDNMPLQADLPDRTPGVDDDEAELVDVEHTRQLQRKLYDSGFAGIVVPKDYGGAGLTDAHAAAFNEELFGYQYPNRNQIPTFAPCLGVLLEFGTHEQKVRHIPPMLTGETLWMQMLSEPSGGSDVAGAQTTAFRDGDEWILNGSKIWTTGAWWSDWALCLARTNPDVAKHRGLTVFMVPMDAPGLEIHRIEMLNGNREFCQEFFTDLRIPDGYRIGEVDDGWTVGVRWMYYERSLATSSLVYLPRRSRDPDAGAARKDGIEYVFVPAYDQTILQVAKETGRLDDMRGRELVGEARVLALASKELNRRVPAAIATGRLSDQAAAINKLMGSTTSARSRQIKFELAGPRAAAWTDEDASIGFHGTDFLLRQVACIAGGTTEMARNVISERVLGMPRERTPDRELPFRQVPKGPPART